MSSARSGWWVLVGLWLVAGCRWITDQVWPASLSSISSEARACAAGAVLAVLWTMLRRTEDPAWRKMIVLAFAGAVLFVGQTAGVVLHGVAGDEYNRAAALCLIPVVVMVACGASGSAKLELWPGLTGLAGALLIFPLTTGGGAWGYVGLIVPVLLVGGACVVAEREAKGLPWAWAAAALLAGGAAGLGLLHWVFLRWMSTEASQPVWQPMVIDLPVVGLAVMALLLAGARRYSASYFAITLLTVAGGAAAMRPGWSWRLAAGMVLMATGVWGVVRRTEADASGLGLAR